MALANPADQERFDTLVAKKVIHKPGGQWRTCGRVWLLCTCGGAACSALGAQRQRAAAQTHRPLAQSPDGLQSAPVPLFVRYCDAAGAVLPLTEYQFAPPRRWRFDFAFPIQRVALEVEGGVWTHGRHTRGSGFVKDVEKYNAAACLGWRLLRVTPKTLCTAATLELIRRALSAGENK